MEISTWTEALAELVAAVRAACVRFWKQDLVQVGLTLAMFLALALPLVLVILILWWIDSTGWRPASGFYKIGDAAERIDLPPKAIAPGPGWAFTERRRPPARGA